MLKKLLEKFLNHFTELQKYSILIFVISLLWVFLPIKINFHPLNIFTKLFALFSLFGSLTVLFCSHKKIVLSITGVILGLFSKLILSFIIISPIFLFFPHEKCNSFQSGIYSTNVYSDRGISVTTSNSIYVQREINLGIISVYNTIFSEELCCWADLSCDGDYIIIQGLKDKTKVKANGMLFFDNILYEETKW